MTIISLCFLSQLFHCFCVVTYDKELASTWNWKPFQNHLLCCPYCVYEGFLYASVVKRCVG